MLPVRNTRGIGSSEGCRYQSVRSSFSTLLTRHTFADDHLDVTDSCWNGMLALSATPFISTNISSRYIGAPGAPSSPAVSGENSGRALQREDKPVVFRAALRSEGECGTSFFFCSFPLVSRLKLTSCLLNLAAASECKTVARDLWSRGFNRWLVCRFPFSSTNFPHPKLPPRLQPFLPLSL